MKKLLFAASSLLLFMFISCKDSDKAATTANAQNEKNKENMASVYRGIETGDVKSMDEFLADDAVDHGDMGDIKGRDSIKAMLSDIHNHFTNLKMDMIAEATSSSGDYHFALVRMTGTAKDDKMGMPANSNVDLTSVDVVKFSNGKVSEHWGFMTGKDMMKMMAANKPAPEANKMDDKMMDKKDTMPKK